jgi:dynamin GTPase
VIFKGYLSILDTGFIVKGAAKNYWFILTAEFLAWYRDDSEVERKYKIPVQGLSIREESSRANAYSFSLFYSDGKPINKEFKQLALTCETREDLNNWKSGFQRAGIGQSLGLGQSQFHDAVSNGSSNSISEVNSFSDLQLDRQVETIRQLVDSYMNIVMRTSRDLVPKIIMNFLIQKTQDFIDQEILVQIQSQDLESLIAESKEESERRNAILRTYQACKKSLEIINEVSIATSSIATATSINHRVTQNGYLDKLTKVSREQRQTSTPLTPPVPRRPTNHGLASGSTGQQRSSSPNQIAG